jgi:hypothetical protein
MELDAWVDKLLEPGNAKTLVDVCDRFARSLTSGASLDRSVAGLPAVLRQDPAFQALWANFGAEYHTKLDPLTSVALCGGMLRAAAADPALRPALADFARGYRDEEQAVLEILALGAAISMIIVVATTRFEATFGAVKVTKSEASAEQIKAAGEWVASLAKLSGGSD